MIALGRTLLNLAVEMALPYMKDFIQINKFSSLHNGQTIIFCKTDYILEEFKYISKLDNKVILITGNSDYCIDDRLINIAPIHNIKVWYAQNALSNVDILKPIPIGIENRFPSMRDGHGIGYLDRVKEKEEILNNLHTQTIPNKFIYANFNINTNYSHRSIIKNISETVDYIDWQGPNLSIIDLYNKYLEYKMILCPIGNGIDTHRLWEVLYCERIPITIKTGNFKLHKLYKMLPIILLDSIEQLSDYEYINKKYNEVLNNKYDNKLMTSDYWIRLIKQKL